MLLVALLAAVFGMYYFFIVSYTVGIFCVTVFLGLLYTLLGASLEPLLLLRLEETAVGALAAVLVAVCVLPLRTRDQVQRSGTGVLTALAKAVATCRDALAGQPGANPVPAMRAVDRQVADLRLAMLPLIAGRFMIRRDGYRASGAGPAGLCALGAGAGRIGHVPRPGGSGAGRQDRAAAGCPGGWRAPSPGHAQRREARRPSRRRRMRWTGWNARPPR